MLKHNERAWLLTFLEALDAVEARMTRSAPTIRAASRTLAVQVAFRYMVRAGFLNATSTLATPAR